MGIEQELEGLIMEERGRREQAQGELNRLRADDQESDPAWFELNLEMLAAAREMLERVAELEQP